MSNLALMFGVLLGILGGVLFGLSDPRAVTALIPAFFGAGLIVCGLIAKNEKLRMHAMHVAALLGLVGCVFPLYRVVSHLMRGGEFRALADGGQLAMSGLSGIFLALCVKSFIDVRKARKQSEAKR